MTPLLYRDAKAIWPSSNPQADEYADFYSLFSCEADKPVTLTVTADSNYAVWCNGTLSAFGQYPDYPHDKVYDEIDLSPFCRAGQNRLAITVWYYGESSFSYYPGQAHLCFAVTSEQTLLCASGADTLCRLSPDYRQHRKKRITPQLGFDFSYDATQADDWHTGEGKGFGKAVVLALDLPLRPRPCKRLTLEEPREAKLVKTLLGGDTIYDLGTNTVGFLRMGVTSENAQTLTVSYGEHLADGCVRRLIGARDFSVELTVKEGRTVYLNPFRRLGARYLQITSEHPVTVDSIALCPVTYPLSERPRPLLTESEREIYDICVNTLRLCMHEHYEDCPWREQGFYCMDSRNQMLCGYYAFGEYEFPRACLRLAASDRREDGLLSICYPTGSKTAIPSFSLHFFTECAEYLRYSGDTELLRKIYPKLESVLNVFLSRMENGTSLLLPLPERWNFYEWQLGLDGHTSPDDTVPDVLLNALLSLALLHMAKISEALGIATDCRTRAATLNDAIRHTFWDEARGLFFDRPTADKTYSVLGNSLCILCGAADGLDTRALCDRLIEDKTVTPISLSMLCFFFDALLQTDREHYRSVILDRIEATYRPMVALGLGTVWETEEGESAFKKAGSLCHGWSALPVYYYHILK